MTIGNPNNAKPTRSAAARDRAILLEAELTDPPDTSWARLLVLAALTAVLGAIVWAYHAPVKEVVVAEGRIHAQNERHILQHSDGGRVEEVFVRQGDFVEAGAPLIRFDRSDELALVAQLEARTAALEAELERARALAEGRPFDSRRAGRSVVSLTSAQAAVYEIQIASGVAQEALLQADIDVALARVSEADNAISHLTRREAIQSRRFSNLSKLSGSRGVVSGRELDSAEIALIDTRSNLAAARTGKRTAELELDRARKAIVEFRLADRRDALEQASSLEARLVETRKETERYARIAARDMLYAPMRARIQTLHVTGSNQVVQPGGEIAHLVPSDQELWAQLTIPADRIGQISPGHPVVVKVLTFDFTRFGTISGSVVGVSPTSDVAGDGSSAYRVHVALSTDHVGAEAAELDLRPGLAVVGDIVLGERSVLEYLLKPLRAAKDRALTES